MNLNKLVLVNTAVEVDFVNNKLYSIAYASKTVTITRYRIPVFDIGLNEKDTTITLEDTTVCSVRHLSFMEAIRLMECFL